MTFGTFGTRACRLNVAWVAVLVLLSLAGSAKGQSQSEWVGTWATAPVLLPSPAIMAPL